MLKVTFGAEMWWRGSAYFQLVAPSIFRHKLCRIHVLSKYELVYPEIKLSDTQNKLKCCLFHGCNTVINIRVGLEIYKTFDGFHSMGLRGSGCASFKLNTRTQLQAITINYSSQTN